MRKVLIIEDCAACHSSDEGWCIELGKWVGSGGIPDDCPLDTAAENEEHY